MEHFKRLWSKTILVVALCAMTFQFTACNESDKNNSDAANSIQSKATGINIYFEKPSSWTTPWIWYDEGSDDVWETTILASEPGDMTYYRTVSGMDWYSKSFSSASTVTFLFNDGSWSSKVDNSGSDFVTTSDIWVMNDGSYYTSDPTEENTDSLTVYFKQPSDWGTPNIYAWVNSSTAVAGSWPGTAMTDASATEGDDWYSYTLSGYTSCNLIFNDGSNQTIDLSRSATGWFVITGTSDGKYTGDWYDSNPDDDGAPSVTISPEGQEFYGDSFEVSINISSTNTISERTCTLTFDDETTQTITLSSNSETLDLVNYLAVGESLSLQVYAKDDEDNETTSTSQSYNRVEEPEGLVVYFKKPSDWSTPNIYAWVDSSTAIAGSWPGTTMTDASATEGEDWYSYTISDYTSCNLIFNDGSSQTEDLSRDSKGWFVISGSSNGKYTGTWYSSNPDDENGTVQKLGVDYSSTSSTFAIWSPDSSNVTVVVDDVEYACALVTISGYSNVYGVVLEGDFNLKEYQFKIDGTAVRDPYGVMVKYEDGAGDTIVENGATVVSNYGSNTNIVIDLDSTDPDDGWSSIDDSAYNEREDAIIYEVHVRDFTIDENSGVSSTNKGKFPGMVESGTVVPGTSLTTGIDHLKELGVTHVQILPFYDSGTRYNQTTESDYNWGYDPVNYNVPEDRYATDTSDYTGRIKELKTMINEFHKNGIRVIMDVVYNHTFRDEMFENITSQYYDGLNLSGCGNSVDSGNDMVSRYIRDSLEYWVEEYNVDGFRFDLIGIFYYDDVNSWGEYLNDKFPDKKLLIYGEPWNGAGGGDSDDPNVDSKVRLGKVPAMLSGHIGVFNDQYRNALKSSDGNGGTTDGGYIFNKGDGDSIEKGLKGSITSTYTTSALPDLWTNQFTADPEQTINYIAAHDNLCLWDKILKAGEDDSSYSSTTYQVAIDKFAAAAILTSQGIPFIHGGDEMLRTKYNSGEVEWDIAHNSYMWGDTPNRIRWSWKNQSTNQAVFDYYKELIAIRKAHPGFRLNSWDEINNWVSTYQYNDGQVIQVTIQSSNNGDSWSQIRIVLNSGSDWTMSDSGWTKVIGDGDGNVCQGTAVTIFSK